MQYLFLPSCRIYNHGNLLAVFRHCEGASATAAMPKAGRSNPSLRGSVSDRGNLMAVFRHCEGALATVAISKPTGKRAVPLVSFWIPN